MTRARKVELICGLVGLGLSLTLLLAQNMTVGTVNSPQVNVSSLVIGAAGGGYDLEENFEGTGYENSWTEVAGTPNEDQDTTSLSLEAAQCLELANEAGALNTYTTFAASDNVYVYFQIRFEDLPTGNARTQFGVSDGSNDAIQAIEGPGPSTWKIYSAGEDVTDLGGNSLSADTTYHVWFEYEKGGGANGALRLYFATTATKPGTAECEITNSDDTFQPTRIFFGNDWSGSAGNFYVDKLRLDFTNPIGSDPD